MEQEEKIDLDSLIMNEIENQFKTVRRLCEDLHTIGIDIIPEAMDVRLSSLRKYNMVDFKVLDFPIVGPKPMAYMKKKT